jgi:pimeloyl-ACP methyl ester carboxylesterase
MGALHCRIPGRSTCVTAFRQKEEQLALEEKDVGAATVAAPDGVRLWYADARSPAGSDGDAAPDSLLFLHGFSGSSSAAGHFRDAVTSAGLGFVSPDLRGHGYSDKPPAPADYAMERFVADAVAVLDACALASAHVVGHCMGGMVAAALAAARPERVESLTLVGTSMRPAQDQRLARWVEHGARQFLQGAFRAALPPADPAESHVDYDRFLETGDFYWRRMIADYRALTVDTAFAITAAIEEFDLMDDAARIKCPTLVVHGARDTVFHLEAAELTAKMVPESQLVVLPEDNHVTLVLDRDSRLFPEVLAFIGAAN